MSDLNVRLKNLARVLGVAPGGGGCDTVMEAHNRIVALEARHRRMIEFVTKRVAAGDKVMPMPAVLMMLQGPMTLTPEQSAAVDMALDARILGLE